MANALQFLSARVTSRMHAAAHRVRARYANQTAARAANTPDLGSGMTLTAFVVGSTRWASYAPPPPSKARELRVSEDPAMHWFDQESASAAPRTDAPRCAGSVGTRGGRSTLLVKPMHGGIFAHPQLPRLRRRRRCVARPTRRSDDERRERHPAPQIWRVGSPRRRLVRVPRAHTVRGCMHARCDARR